MYNAEYKKDPFTVTLDIRNMKRGLYHVVGEASSASWADACKRINVPEKGACSADVTVEKCTSREVKVSGAITFSSERTCGRTLKVFMDEETIQFEDVFSLEAVSEDEDAVFLETEQLEMADLLAQMIILNQNPYPIHPSVKSQPEGAFDISDGIQEEVDEEKNPFSVLKSLKSKQK